MCSQTPLRGRVWIRVSNDADSVQMMFPMISMHVYERGRLMSQGTK